MIPLFSFSKKFFQVVFKGLFSFENTMTEEMKKSTKVIDVEEMLKKMDAIDTNGKGTSSWLYGLFAKHKTQEWPHGKNQTNKPSS